MNVKLDTYNTRELGRPYKKRFQWEKNHLRNLGLQRLRTSKLDSPKGDFNCAAIILYSRPIRQYSLSMGRERLYTGYKITLSPTIAWHRILSLRSKRFQSSYGAKVRAGAKKDGRGKGREKRKRLPANPTILENAPWYFTVGFIAGQNRSITNRLPLDYQICKITLFSNRTRCRRLQEL